MSWKIFFYSLAEAAETSAMIFTIVFGALILNNFVNIAEMPNAIIDFIKTISISPINVIFVLFII